MESECILCRRWMANESCGKTVMILYSKLVAYCYLQPHTNRNHFPSSSHSSQPFTIQSSMYETDILIYWYRMTELVWPIAAAALATIKSSSCESNRTEIEGIEMEDNREGIPCPGSNVLHLGKNTGGFGARLQFRTPGLGMVDDTKTWFMWYYFKSPESSRLYRAPALSLLPAVTSEPISPIVWPCSPINPVWNPFPPPMSVTKNRRKVEMRCSPMDDRVCQMRATAGLRNIASNMKMAKSWRFSIQYLGTSSTCIAAVFVFEIPNRCKQC